MAQPVWRHRSNPGEPRRSPADPNATPALGPLKRVRTSRLGTAYAEAGPPDGQAVLLLHGWPYDIHTYAEVAPRLAAAGFGVIVPYLRGYGATRFHSDASARRGSKRPWRATRWNLSGARPPHAFSRNHRCRQDVELTGGWFERASMAGFMESRIRSGARSHPQRFGGFRIDRKGPHARSAELAVRMDRVQCRSLAITPPTAFRSGDVAHQIVVAAPYCGVFKSRPRSTTKCLAQFLCESGMKCLRTVTCSADLGESIGKVARHESTVPPAPRGSDPEKRKSA